MSQHKCPIQSCGRILESAIVLRQHIKRRHPSKPQLHKNEDEKVTQDEISKLPKISTLKKQSDQQKLPEIYRKSQSKEKKEHGSTGLNKSKITSVIAQSRSILSSAESGSASRNLKRPSLNKRNSNQNSSMVSEKQKDRFEKLPQLRVASGRKKIEIVNQQMKLNLQTSQLDKGVMSSTAPYFKKIEKKQIKLRQRSHSKQVTNLVKPKDQQLPQHMEDSQFIKTSQGFYQKESKTHKPLKRLLEKSAIELIKQTKQSQLEQDAVIQIKQPHPKIIQRRSIELKHQLKPKSRKQPFRRSQSKNQQTSTSISDNYNFEQKIIVFQPNIGPKLTIPPFSKLQYLYANNCKLTTLSLGNIQSIRQISVLHNSIKQMSFLSFPNNHNIEKLFIDHNLLTTIDYLPPFIKVFSATFNNISGLSECSQELSKLESLEEVDFSFNPIRKQSNYKLHIISSMVSLRKIDGIKVTKFDVQLASQYARLVDQELGLIPSNKFKNLVVSKCSNSPSTMISYGEDQIEASNTNQFQIDSEIAKLQKVIKQTKSHLDIIKKENQIIKDEIKQLDEKAEEVGQDQNALYIKLRTECASLQLLNFLQYASEQELQEMIIKKKRESVY